MKNQLGHKNLVKIFEQQLFLNKNIIKIKKDLTSFF